MYRPLYAKCIETLWTVFIFPTVAKIAKIWRHGKFKLFVIVASILFCLIFMIFAARCNWKDILTRKPPAQSTLPQSSLKKITLQTNGKISSPWLADRLKIKKNIDLFTLDISRIERDLMAIPQIKKVTIIKKYPDTLSIQIEERQPLLQVLVNYKTIKKLLLVARDDGIVFPPIGYHKHDLENIPFANLKLINAPDGNMQFRPLGGLSGICELTHLLQTEFIPIFKMIKFIDLSNYDSRAGADWARITILLKNGLEVIFGTREFKIQLSRLDFLINEKYRDRLLHIQRINLIHPENIVLQYK